MAEPDPKEDPSLGALLDSLQQPGVRERLETAFAASPEELGRAAVAVDQNAPAQSY